MKKKILLLTLLIGTLLLTGCSFKSKPRQAALDFKNEYEQVNGKEIREGLKWRTLNIAEDNPYVKTTDDDIAKKIQNGETFYLYVGDHLCPWCRSGLEKMIEVAKKNKVDTIYYIDFWDDNHKEILRDLYEVEVDGKKVKFNKTQDAVEGYDELVAATSEFLQDYTIDKDGKTYNVGVKRTYGGDHFKFENGKCTKYVSLRSDKLENALGELTEEVLKDQETKFTEFFKDSNACYGQSNC